MLVFLALGNAKVLSFALGDAKLPDERSLASQWYIGFRPARPFCIVSYTNNCNNSTSLSGQVISKNKRCSCIIMFILIGIPDPRNETLKGHNTQHRGLTGQKLSS